MKALSILAYPIVRIFEYLVKKMGSFGAKKIRRQVIREELQELYELRAAVSLARAARLIGAHEEKIVLAAAHLSGRHIRDIMIPAVDISMIPIDVSLNEALIRAHLDLHTRFPVCSKEGDPQTIEGYINFKDIVLALKMSPQTPNVRGITRAITRVYSMSPIADVLSLMMQNKTHIALVTARDGKILGLITLEDILEELVGEIEDEFDRLSLNIQPYGNAWLSGGGVPMKVLAKKLEIPDFPEDSPEGAMSLAEWCTKKLGGRPPKGGETFNIANISIIVRKLRRRRLSEAIVSRTTG
jgi:putative hemolysin